MTKEEAIPILYDMYNYYNDKNIDDSVGYAGFDVEDSEALEMAVKALEQDSKIGEWRREEFPNVSRDAVFTVVWICNKCGKGSYRKFNYCPNCGIKMQEVNK